MMQQLFVLGLLALIFTLSSRLIRRTWFLSEASVAFLVGVAAGPLGSGWLDLDWSGSDTHILEFVARLILGLTVMEIALRLPPAYPIRKWRSLATILVGVMPLMALVSGLLVFWLAGVPFWVAMLIGAVTIPTDPVIASAIVNGRLASESLPGDTRNILSAETGANDGLAYPLVLLCIFMVTMSAEEAVSSWLTEVLSWQVVGGVVVGASLGYMAANVRTWAERGDLIEPQMFYSYTVALTILVIAVASWAKLDGFLAIFAAGVTYRIGSDTAEREYVFQEGLSSFLVFPAFALVGAVMPWSAWAELGWEAVVLAAAVILLRRLPVVLLLSHGIPALAKKRDVWFFGWFGPIGMDTFFFAMLAVERTGREEVWEVASLLLFASLLSHGLSATPLTRLYTRDRSQNPSTAKDGPARSERITAIRDGRALAR